MYYIYSEYDQFTLRLDRKIKTGKAKEVKTSLARAARGHGLKSVAS